MAITHTITVLEQIPVAPPPEATTGISLPFTFLDVLWLHMAPVHRLIFYQHPISRTQFKDTLIPNIKNSLSLSLQHYTPLAGRVIVPSDNSILPEIRYKEGDTVPLVIAECNSGEGHFSHLTSDYDARSCSDFHPLVPSLPPTSRASDGSIIVPLFALQVTLFPDVGICIGVTNHHAVGDASSIFGFMKAWAFFSRHCHEDENSPPVSLPPEFEPLLDRTLVKDPNGITKTLWDSVKNTKVEDTHVHRLPSITNKVRATFVVTRGDIQLLKNHVQSRRPKLLHLSSFTMVCSYVFTCLAKSRNETYKEDEQENFMCAADVRARLDPPLPRNYFGNCVTAGCIVRSTSKRVLGEDGFAEAAQMIGENIHSQMYNKGGDHGAFTRPEKMFEILSKLNFDRTLSVAGSPKFDYYELDFGWGKPKKFEMPSIDITGAISVSTAKGYEFGLEVGISLPTSQMDTFTKVFTQGLKTL